MCLHIRRLRTYVCTYLISLDLTEMGKFEYNLQFLHSPRGLCWPLNIQELIQEISINLEIIPVIKMEHSYIIFCLPSLNVEFAQSPLAKSQRTHGRSKRNDRVAGEIDPKCVRTASCHPRQEQAIATHRCGGIERENSTEPPPGTVSTER